MFAEDSAWNYGTLFLLALLNIYINAIMGNVVVMSVRKTLAVKKRKKKAKMSAKVSPEEQMEKGKLVEETPSTLQEMLKTGIATFEKWHSVEIPVLREKIKEVEPDTSSNVEGDSRYEERSIFADRGARPPRLLRQLLMARRRT